MVGRHYCESINQIVYEKMNPETNKFVKIVKGICSTCGRDKSQTFTKLMTPGENFIKKRKCKNIHCSAMSSSAWCDLNSKVDKLKLHDICHNPECKCQKQITFTPRQFQLERSSFQNTMKKTLRGLKQLGKNFFNSSG